MRNLARISALPLALLLDGATPAAKIISHPGSPNLALVIPSGSPVRFRGWKDGYADFDGQFVISGNYALSVSENCAVGETCLVLDIEPDPAIAARLPRWSHAGGLYFGNIFITLVGEQRFVQAIADSRKRAALLTGKIRPLSGRTSIIVDDFSTGVECESEYYTARFVAIAKPPKIAQTDFSGGFGCGP